MSRTSGNCNSCNTNSCSSCSANNGRCNVTAGYGRNMTAAIQNQAVAACQTEKSSARAIKGYGTINSTGVIPDGCTCTLINDQTEVEFTIDIYRKSGGYQGQLYMVCYDTRKKISSNQLLSYQMLGDEEAICIFCVQYQKGINTCVYELMVSMSPSNCQSCQSGALFAYSPPIYNEGVNMGGSLKSGEIIFYDEKNSCDCGCD